MVYSKIYGEMPVNRKEILRYMGVTNGDGGLTELLDECLEESLACLSYKVCFCEFPISFVQNKVELGFAESESSALMKNLDGCDSVVLFAATLGIELDRSIARHSSLSPAKTIMLHAIGNERIESLCDAFCADIAKEKQAVGQFTRPRFSPGYGGFSLDVQRNIFSVLDCQKRIGLALNGSLLMSPSKSVTAVIGVGKKDKK